MGDPNLFKSAEHFKDSAEICMQELGVSRALCWLGASYHAKRSSGSKCPKRSYTEIPEAPDTSMSRTDQLGNPGNYGPWGPIPAYQGIWPGTWGLMAGLYKPRFQQVLITGLETAPRACFGFQSEQLLSVFSYIATFLVLGRFLFFAYLDPWT